MQQLEKLLTHPKSRKVAIILALLSTIVTWPIAGVHKFYLGQPVWGVIYLLLWNTPIPSIACAIDAVWYFVQGEDQFNAQFNNLESNPHTVYSKHIESLQVNVISDGLRELDKLREEGLLSDYEFEQKRRKLLDRIS
ncbi:NINE protein [Crocosphaera sp.]|uniref:NINE protein n=1 Tax=Crocosphaera sp. TaxID=2729996 RepID=UPI003F23C45F